MTLLPRLTDMVTADEYTLSVDQELRLLDDRDKRSRWFHGSYGSPAPGAYVDSGRFIEPWPPTWAQVNDPAQDDMVSVCILDEADPGEGILIWVHPTPAARDVWETASNGSPHMAVPVALACETSIRHDPDYRCVFSYAYPLGMITPQTVRWGFRRPPSGAPAWEVLAVGVDLTKHHVSPPAWQVEE